MAIEHTFHIRAGTNDHLILGEVQTAYFPAYLPYASFRRVVDLGAHIGGFTCVVKLRSPACEVIAIEALPDNVSLLRRNVEGFEGVTVVPQRLAYLWNRVRLVQTLNNTGANGWVPDDSQPVLGGSTTFELSLWLNGPIDLLKVDIEGAEQDVLNNAPLSTLQRFRHIVGEYHSRSGDPDVFIRRLFPLFRVRAYQPSDSELGTFWLENRVMPPV